MCLISRGRSDEKKQTETRAKRTMADFKSGKFPLPSAWPTLAADKPPVR